MYLLCAWYSCSESARTSSRGLLAQRVLLMVCRRVQRQYGLPEPAKPGGCHGVSMGMVCAPRPPQVTRKCCITLLLLTNMTIGGTRAVRNNLSVHTPTPLWLVRAFQEGLVGNHTAKLYRHITMISGLGGSLNECSNNQKIIKLLS